MIVGFVGLGLAQLVQIIGVVWYLSGRLTRMESRSESNGEELKELDSKFEKHMDAFDSHVLDAKVHTTEEQRRDISRRIDKLEELVTTGHRDLSNKLDTWATRILSK